MCFPEKPVWVGVSSVDMATVVVCGGYSFWNEWDRMVERELGIGNWELGDGYAVVKVPDSLLHGYCRTIILICQEFFENCLVEKTRVFGVNSYNLTKM
ncbi:MAG: hypothetical protein CVU39_13425 [Chloroflexi bacterium HGW-Chloroflexi-10]|nr:MAG: hypothetical protein CVU39_13425 [Chloroflexi bacterium HGW-Chloroflexi-10]